MLRQIQIYLLIVLSILMTSCSPNLWDISKANTTNVKNNQDALLQKAYPRPPAVVSREGAYVDITPVSLEAEPSWLKKRVIIHGNNLPFSFYISQILSGSHVVNNYDNTVQPGKLVSVDYEGTVQGALKELAARTNYHYILNKKHRMITWSSFETRVFDVSFMPGDVQYQVGENAGALSLSGGGSTGGSSGSSGSSSSGQNYNFSQDTQFSNITGTISIWKDLAAGIKALLSKEGTAQVSQATTTITVHDHPQNVNAIAEYIAVMNAELSKQVRIQVQLLEVRLAKNFAYGINWDLVRNRNGNSWTLTGNMAANVGSIGTFSPVGITFSSSNNRWAGTDTIIQALQVQGDVSLITQPTVTTMNDQVATISIQQQRAYESGGSTTMNNNLAQTSINVSNVVTGFNLYLLPKIQGDKIYLQISSILSNLTAMRTFNVNTGAEGDAASQSSQSTDQPANEANANSSPPNQNNNSTNATNNNGTNSGPSVVQLPETALRSFNQRSVIPNGATLILSGYIQRENSDAQSNAFATGILAAKGATAQTVELVMLITPVILDSHENDLAPAKGYEAEVRS